MGVLFTGDSGQPLAELSQASHIMSQPCTSAPYGHWQRTMHFMGAFQSAAKRSSPTRIRGGLKGPDCTRHQCSLCLDDCSEHTPADWLRELIRFCESSRITGRDGNAADITGRLRQGRRGVCEKERHSRTCLGGVSVAAIPASSHLAGDDPVLLVPAHTRERVFALLATAPSARP